VAIEVARTLLPAFDNLQEQANSLRTLISASRQVDGEADAGLLRQGLNLVSDLRDEEKKREAASGTAQGSPQYHPSDDLEIYLISQSASDDFNAAMRRARSMEDNSSRIRALVQIAQTLMSNY
jgi:hypothetical protein